MLAKLAQPDLTFFHAICTFVMGSDADWAMTGSDMLSQPSCTRHASHDSSRSAGPFAADMAGVVQLK